LRSAQVFAQLYLKRRKHEANHLFTTDCRGAYGAATADPITLTLQNNDLSTTAGGNVTFLATAINDMSFLVNLNADSFSVAAPLTVDDTAFQNDWFDLTATRR